MKKIMLAVLVLISFFAGLPAQDNLGNHVATTTLDMSNFNIVNVSSIAFSGLEGGILLSPYIDGTRNYVVYQGVAIGSGTYANYGYGIGVGYVASNNYAYGVGVGYNAYNNYEHGVGVGDTAYNNYSGGVGVGYSASNNHDSGVGIGGMVTFPRLLDQC